jgi:hypothetical protein
MFWDTLSEKGRGGSMLVVHPMLDKFRGGRPWNCGCSVTYGKMDEGLSRRQVRTIMQVLNQEKAWTMELDPRLFSTWIKGPYTSPIAFTLELLYSLGSQVKKFRSSIRFQGCSMR